MTTLTELLDLYIFENEDNELQKWIDRYDFPKLLNGLEEEEDRFIKVLAGNVYRDEFIDEVFNTGDYNFGEWVNCDETMERMCCASFYTNLRRAAEWYKEMDSEFDIINLDEEQVLNKLAYWFVSDYYSAEERFISIFAPILESLLEEKREAGRTHRLECDICKEAKRIEGICFSCGTKQFCFDCWNRTANKDNNCPFCRCKMLHNVGERRLEVKQEVGQRRRIIRKKEPEVKVDETLWFHNLTSCLDEMLGEE
jgi:hypothetical protein